MEIGTAIKIIRKNKGYSQGDFAILCDMSVNALCQIEKNNSIPQKYNLKSICKVLNVPVSYILFFSISDEDIPEEKRKMFYILSNAIKELLI